MSSWQLYALKKCDGWQGALRETWDTEQLVGDVLSAEASGQPDGTILRVVTPNGTTYATRVVSKGKACRPRFSDNSRRLLDDAAQTAWSEDPASWWQSSMRGYEMFQVAGEAVVHAGAGSQLHRDVVCAACCCVRAILGEKENYFFGSTCLRDVLEMVDCWCKAQVLPFEVLKVWQPVGNTPERDWRSVRNAADRAVLAAMVQTGIGRVDDVRLSNEVWEAARWAVAAVDAVVYLVCGELLDSDPTPQYVVVRCAEVAAAEARGFAASMGLSTYTVNSEAERLRKETAMRCAEYIKYKVNVYDVLMYLIA